MADAVWPVSLPQAPRLAELDETPPELVVRTQMDAGPAKVRRRHTANVRPFTIALNMTRAQVATFDDFFVNTVKSGALAFQWKHPRTANLIDYRFVGQPTYRPRSPRLASATEPWRVVFTLEALPGTEITEGSPPPPPPDDQFGQQLLASIRWPEEEPVAVEEDPVFATVPLDQLIFTVVAPVTADLPFIDPLPGAGFDFEDLDPVAIADSGVGVVDPHTGTSRKMDTGDLELPPDGGGEKGDA